MEIVMHRVKACIQALLRAMAATLLMTGQSPAHDWVKAGPIWNDADADRKCPKTCGKNNWDGAWKTTKPGKMSVCSCGGASRSRTYQVDAGPIWGDFDAPKKCKAACGSSRWDGNWRTVSGGTSTCDCQR